MRRDARKHRDAIIGSATECFGEFGYQVPIEEIASRAGVGRATLYRHFKDRLSLALAVFERWIDDLEDQFDRDVGVEEAIRQFVRIGQNGEPVFRKLASELPADSSDMPLLRSLEIRMIELVAPIVEKAHREGRARQGVRAEDLLLSMRMVSGVVSHLQDSSRRERRLNEAVALVLHGLAAHSPTA